MEYYFNELSCQQTVPDESAIYYWVESFAKTCVELKKIGFKTFRSTVYLSQIEVINGYTLGDWMRDRSIGNRDLQNRDLQRKFLLLDTKMPLLEVDDEDNQKLEWALFSHGQRQVTGLAVAFLKNSVCISLPSHGDWEHPIVEVIYEFIDAGNDDDTVTSNVKVRHCATVQHIEAHREFAIEKLKAIPPPPDWNPQSDYLPNVKVSTSMLSISEFYQINKTKSRGEKIANILIVAAQIAGLNYYEKDETVSKKNRTNERIREIYRSKNEIGNPIFLSVDVEVGAFEVCDYSGTHIEEILFDGTRNGGQELDHSIQI